MKHIDIHLTARRLCEESDRLGLDNPSESMISNCLLDTVCNTLNAAVETAREIDGNQDSQVMKMYRLLGALSGPMAERLAGDMDHGNKDHSAWYKKVKEARKFLAAIGEPQ